MCYFNDWGCVFVFISSNSFVASKCVTSGINIPKSCRVRNARENDKRGMYRSAKNGIPQLLGILSIPEIGPAPFKPKNSSNILCLEELVG